MHRILFVVHRYAPYPGGSENNVKNMAEEMASRGVETWVFSGTHQGDLNGVHVTSNPEFLLHPWDLIIVHGGDVGIQNFVLEHAKNIPSPILYLLILPSESPTCLQALQDVKYIGCATRADWRHVKKYGVESKSVRYRYGINLNDSESTAPQGEFRTRFGIDTRFMFISCGGYWPNKNMHRLVDLFRRVNRDDITLVLTGYDNAHTAPRVSEHERIKVLTLPFRNDVLSGIKDADLCIMHSTSEGFGIVLLESMLNYTPWAGYYIAGAETMQDYGFTYQTETELLNHLQHSWGTHESALIDAHNYVVGNHTNKQCVDDILRLIQS
jgi:glycosyltransferase involved in cell wall biosynthesis